MLWLNTPCTDPVGRMFAADGAILRAIFPEQAQSVRSIIHNRIVQALMEEGLIVRMRETMRRMDGFDLIVESEKAPFDIPCDRYTRATVREAALRWLQISGRLLASDLVLSDAHYGNYMLFGANEPRWVDLGSIRPSSFVESEKPFRSFRRFWSGMLAPLAVLATQPQRARLARLAIADHPYQGPLTPVGESPLTVDEEAAELLERLRADVEALDAAPALERLSAFVLQLPRQKGHAAAALEPAASAVLKSVEEQLRSTSVSTVVCLGCDAFRQFSGAWGKSDALVIDEDESDLDCLGSDLQRSPNSGQIALCLAHPVNRIFLKAAPSADAVLALDPLARYAHHSSVAAENLAHILGKLGTRIALVITPAERRTATEQMLKHVYVEVASVSGSWFGRGPAVVIGKNAR
jgi:hypothetical protein